jgi:DNA-directed RNA polymerase specialized sigma24 family protein
MPPSGLGLVFLRYFPDLFDAFAGRMGSRHALAELFQETLGGAFGLLSRRFVTSKSLSSHDQ